MAINEVNAVLLEQAPNAAIERPYNFCLVCHHLLVLELRSRDVHSCDAITRYLEVMRCAEQSFRRDASYIETGATESFPPIYASHLETMLSRLYCSSITTWPASYHGEIVPKWDDDKTVESYIAAAELKLLEALNRPSNTSLPGIFTRPCILSCLIKLCELGWATVSCVRGREAMTAVPKHKMYRCDSNTLLRLYYLF